MSVWVAGITAAVALGSAYMNKESARKAANSQIDAANQANTTQTNIYNNQTKLMAPWRNAGASSVEYLSYLMGVPGYENWQPGMDMGTGKKAAPSQQTPHVPYNGATFLSSTGATGDPLNVFGGFGLSTHPQTGNETASAPTQQPTLAMGGQQMGQGGLPRFNSPMDAGFQQLPSGAQFMGPDGIVRRKH